MSAKSEYGVELGGAWPELINTKYGIPQNAHFCVITLEASTFHTLTV